MAVTSNLSLPAAQRGGAPASAVHAQGNWPRASVPPDQEWARQWCSVDPEDTLHQPTPAAVQWTTVNLGEVFPGVPTPLNWAVLAATGEKGLRSALHSIGVYAARDLKIPDDPGERTIGIMWGRAVANLTKFREFADRSPGNSGDAMEAQIFGSNETQGGSHPQYARYPFVAAKMPISAIQRRRKLVALGEETQRWWADAVFPARAHDRLAATALLWDAHRRIADIFDPHNVMMMVALAVYAPVRAMTERIGMPDLATALLYTGDTAESKTVADLWALSRDQMTLADFVHHHGFHGPRENEASSRVWREDASPVQKLMERYRQMNESENPTAGAERRMQERHAAELTLMSKLSAVGRVKARLLLRLARHYVPTREMGRDAFLKGMDVVRYSARVIGADLVRLGLIDEVDDTFYLTPFELTELPPRMRERVALRRASRARYEQLEVPQRWTGLVQPAQASHHDFPEEVRGMGVSAGVVEGLVRVMLDPSDDDLEDGEILVCRTTDPGWASYFFIAAGVVIDIGGPLSHGAIVARELGLPCVINAKNATRQLHTGDRVRIDGTTGEVEILARANVQETTP